MTELLELIEEEVTNSHSVQEIKQKFVDKGYLEEDIDAAMDKLSELMHRRGLTKTKKNVQIFTSKELLDRIGFGFASHQFINILFMLSGAGLFFIGVFNGLKSIISVVLSSMTHEYTKVHDIHKKFISKTGIVFGFSYLFIAWAISIESPWLFAVALLVGSLGVVTYGDVFQQLMDKSLKKEKRNHFLAKISYYGLIITALSILISGWMIDFTGMDGRIVNYFGRDMRVFGYLNSFFITSVALILSGYFISFVSYKREKTYSFKKFGKEYFSKISTNFREVLKTKYVLWLIIANTVIAAVQVIGNSYYGIFIYQTFKDSWFGGFTNVAIVFGIAVLVSFFGPFITKSAHKHIGLSPMLVFGTLLVALMPLVLAFNPNLTAIIIANTLSILGATIVGTANGLFARKLLSESHRTLYFSSVSVFSTLPLLALVPIGAYLASIDYNLLFKVLSASLVILVMPLYFVLVLISEKNNEKI